MRPLVDVGAELDLSGRRLNYWLNKGWVTATFHDADGVETERGSGTRAYVSTEQEVRLQWMVRLIAAGFEPEKAAEVGLRLAQGQRGIELAPGLLLIREGAR